MKNVVITGPTGAIGISLIKRCIESQTKVLALIHRGSPRNAYIPASSFVKKVECDLENLKDLEVKTEESFDAFYHLAWKGGNLRDNILVQKTNIEYVLEAVKLANKLKCKVFIGAGSQAEYGLSKCPLNGNTPVFPCNVFGASKLYAGYMSRFLAHQLGMKHIWTRILSVYGPYDGKQTMIISTIEKMLKGEKPLFTNGEQIWDFIFSVDAAEAMYRLGEDGVDGKIYTIGSGTARPLKEYIIQIRNNIDSNLMLNFGEISYSKNQVMYLCADIADLVSDTGFKPKVSFEKGIRETIEWVKSEKDENN